jgi:FAD-dependent urate hydroxylase
MSPNKRKVLIIGCGITSPALALFLKRAGIDSEIYEARSSSEEEAGFFLYLAPNGVNILKLLKLEQDLEVEGFATTGLHFYNSVGKFIGEIDSRTDKEQFGVQGFLLKRAHLHKLLRDEVLRQGIPIHFDKKLEMLE